MMAVEEPRLLKMLKAPISLPLIETGIESAIKTWNDIILPYIPMEPIILESRNMGKLSEKVNSSVLTPSSTTAGTKTFFRPYLSTRARSILT